MLLLKELTTQQIIDLIKEVQKNPYKFPQTVIDNYLNDIYMRCLENTSNDFIKKLS